MMRYFLTMLILAQLLVACGDTESTQTSIEAEVPAPEATETVTEEQSPSIDRTETDVNSDYPYTIVDTDQTYCFSESGTIACGESYNGQDAQYEGVQPAYQDNGDGTITDLNTGLMWIQDAGEKTTYADAMAELETYTFAGYDDWRLPTIKELYSLALFSGVDASATNSSDVDGLWPLIDDDYFVFIYGDKNGGNRVIDAQWLSSTIYNSTVNNGQNCFFGFNFSDGRIKCYGLEGDSPSGGYFAQYVRGGDTYGINDFVDNGDGTITDNATGLTWTQNDNGAGAVWDDALNYCEALSLGNTDDWRLPNIKELHSIVDYDRSPDVTNSAAIDPLFNLTPITNEADESDYGFYWSSTTLISHLANVSAATYISFGRALGYQEQLGGWVDVHGSGAQRSDPKVLGEETYEFGHGPQGDAVRISNYVLCVNGGVAEPSNGDDPSTLELSDVDIVPEENGDIPGADETDPQAGPNSEGPNLAAAAAALGITEQELRDALGTPPPDFESVAETLGITVEELQNALGGDPGSVAPHQDDITETPVAETDVERPVEFKVTDTQQEYTFDNDGNIIDFPVAGEALYGQDAQYTSIQPSFRDNGNGTVSDLVTGLLWEQTPTFETYQHEDGVAYYDALETASYDDWRLPTIAELYSLADYRGELLLDEVSTPYIDTTYFDFKYPPGDRQYAAQYWSSTRYEVPPNNQEEDQMKYFGFNFADGHIKAYGTSYTFDGTAIERGFAPGMYVRCVSGAENVYGVNQFVDNGDGTITDTATGLMWQQTDDAQTRNWRESRSGWL